MNALHINGKDNVAIVLSGDIQKGEQMIVRNHSGETSQIKALNDIPYGHKVALRAIAAGEHIIKYGEVIGGAAKEIAVGEHVHVHNMDSLRGRGDLEH